MLSSLLSPMQSMEEFVAALPKAELHVHLEGSVEPETLWELAVRQGSALAAEGRQSLRALYATCDFNGFLQAFKTVCLHLQTPEDYELVTYNALRRLAAQNVKYAEVTLSAGAILWKGQDLDAIFPGVERGTARACQELGIRTQWIFDAVRQFGPEAAWPVARAAARWQDRGVIGIGIGGDEQGGPAEWFRDVFAFAREQALRLTAHAGETAGPESIRQALDVLGAERIGHGVAAAQDFSLMERLAIDQIPLEVCLTSNVRTAAVAELAQHPLRLFFDRGVRVSLHTDDPALFGTDLNREYLLAHTALGFSREELRRLAMNSFEAAFLSSEEKQSYLAAFQASARV